MMAKYELESTFPALPRTCRAKPIVLGDDPNGKYFLYCNGVTVVMRDIEDPPQSKIYAQHKSPTTVAKFNCKATLIASADEAGHVRIWDCQNQDLKFEYKDYEGNIRDMAWSPDGNRLVLVGDQKNCVNMPIHIVCPEHVIYTIKLAGHSGPVLSCDYRPTKLFRVITGGEDSTISVFHGPPYVFHKTLLHHSRSFHIVRYSPDGNCFASGGQDGKVCLYDAINSEIIGEIGSPVHSSCVNGLSWSKYMNELLTASAERTCKLWDSTTRYLSMEFAMGKHSDDQQVGCLWQTENAITVSASGCITYLDLSDEEIRKGVVTGQRKACTILYVEKENIYTGSHDVSVIVWNSKTGVNNIISGVGHKSDIKAMIAYGDILYTCGLDNTLRLVDLINSCYKTIVITLLCQPRGLDIKNNTIYIATLKGVIISSISSDDLKQIGKLPLDYEPSSISVSVTNGDISVRGAVNNIIHVYKKCLSEKTCLEHQGQVTGVMYSPNGALLAAADSRHRLVVYCSMAYNLISEWRLHKEKINAISWSPDSNLLASVGLDSSIFVYSMKKPEQHVNITCAHPLNQISGISWLNQSHVVSTAYDGHTKVWKLKDFPEEDPVSTKESFAFKDIFPFCTMTEPHKLIREENNLLTQKLLVTKDEEARVCRNKLLESQAKVLQWSSAFRQQT